jgi:hypothetical protein
VGKSQDVVGSHHRVGVQNDQVVAVVEGDARGVASDTVQQTPHSVAAVAKATTHQRDVRVEVHRLVGFVRKIHIPLALERAHGDVEAARELPICIPQATAIDHIHLDTA